MLSAIHLHGPLADEFGHEPVTMDVEDFQSLLSALECAYPGFRGELRKHKGVAVGLVNGDKIEFLTEQKLGWQFGPAEEIHVATDQEGEGLEVAAASWMASAVVTTAGAKAATWASVTGWAAVAYAAVYVATIAVIAYVTSSIVKTFADKPENARTGKEDPSALFDQAVNLEGQGHPIPLVYGTFKVGSVVISADIVSEKAGFVVDDSVVVQLGQPANGNIYVNDSPNGAISLIQFVINGVLYSPGDVYSFGGTVFSISTNGNFTSSSTVPTTLFVSCFSLAPTTPRVESRLVIRWTGANEVETLVVPNDLVNGNVFSQLPNGYGSEVMDFIVDGITWPIENFNLYASGISLKIRSNGSYQAFSSTVGRIDAICRVQKDGVPLDNIKLTVRWGV